MNLSAILQVFINKIEIGFGTIDLVDRLLSLFKVKHLHLLDLIGQVLNGRVKKIM